MIVLPTANRDHEAGEQRALASFHALMPSGLQPACPSYGVRPTDKTVLLYVKFTMLRDGDLNKQYYLSYKLICLLEY